MQRGVWVKHFVKQNPSTRKENFYSSTQEASCTPTWASRREHGAT